MMNRFQMMACMLFLFLHGCGGSGGPYTGPGWRPDPHALKTELLNYDTHGTGGTVRVLLSYRGDDAPSTVLIAVPSAGYNARYYDAAAGSGLTPGKSFLNTFTDAGYAVATLYLPGTDSPFPMPDGDKVNLAVCADVLHQVALMLKVRYPRVLYTGHGLGAAIVMRAQADYADAVAVSVQGFSTDPHDLPIPAALVADLLKNPWVEYPAAIRAAFFLPPPYAPDVVGADMFAADHAPRGLVRDMINLSRNPEPVRQTAIRVPIIVQQAEGDLMYPPAVWDAAARVNTYRGLAHALEFGSDQYADPVRKDLLDAFIALTGGPKIK